MCIQMKRVYYCLCKNTSYLKEDIFWNMHISFLNKWYSYYWHSKIHIINYTQYIQKELPYKHTMLTYKSISLIHFSFFEMTTFINLIIKLEIVLLKIIKCCVTAMWKVATIFDIFALLHEAYLSGAWGLTISPNQIAFKDMKVNSGQVKYLCVRLKWSY